MMRQRIAKKLKEKKGFTLIELIIVIAIIAILIALIAPNLMKFLDTSKQTKANAAAKTLYTSASTYLVDKYTNDAPITDATWDSTAAAGAATAVPAEFLSDYFNNNEIKATDSFTVKIVGGEVTEAKWVSDGFTGKYPK